MQWICKCSCGNETLVDGFELRKESTKSCGFCKKQEYKGPEMIGRKFGKLTVLAKDTSAKYGRCSMSKWICQCECGAEVSVLGTVLRRGQTSCGCVNSKGEEQISNLLSQWGVQFKRQQSFKDLVSYSGKPLLFDFSITDHDNRIILIEYQGIQHYIPQTDHFGDYQRTISDPLKRQYCKSH